MKVRLAHLALVLAGCLFAACSTSRYDGKRFSPSPQEVELVAQGVDGSQVRALVSVLGVVRAHDGQPAEVEVRLRFENLGSVAAHFSADDLSLLSADLQPFARPRVKPTSSTTIEPRGEVAIDVVFPLPPGRARDDLDWSALNIRFALVFADQKVTGSMNFARAYRAYDEPRSHFSFGLGVSH